DRRRLVLELDDVLHLVPFDALPLDAGGTLLAGERWRIETRATLQELWGEDTKPEGGPTLLAIGGVTYDHGGSEASAAGGAVAAVLRGGAWNAGFPGLPATAEEARGVGAQFAAAFGAGAPATVLERSDATRGRLIELAPGARFLH